MNFEEKLKRVVDEYNNLLGSAPENQTSEEIDSNRKEILKIHPNISKEKFEERRIRLKEYRIPFPGGKKIFNEHPLAKLRYDMCPDDGEVDVYYYYSCSYPTSVEEIALEFHPGLTPPIIQPENDFWRKRGGQWVGDAMYNESKHGIIYAFLADGNGKFYSKRESVEKAKSLVGVGTWSLRIQDYILTIKFPVTALGSGEVTAFFKHMDYDGLDEMF